MTSNSGSGAPTLGEMIVANTIAAAAAPPAPAPPPEPVIPTAASEAATRLAEIKADPKWRDEYLAGSPRHAKELRALQAVIDKGQAPQTEMAIAGQLYDGIQPSGHLAAVGTAEHLRGLGVDDGVIRQVLAGEPVTAQEHQAATSAKARLMGDQDFTKKYLAGDGDARRTLTLLNVITSSSIKKVA